MKTYNLAELRVASQDARPLETAGRLAVDAFCDAATPETMLALISAVEASVAHVEARRDRAPSEWPRLLAALAPFRDLP